MLILLFSMACSAPETTFPFNIGNGNLFVAGKNTEDSGQSPSEDTAEEVDDSASENEDSGPSGK